MAYYDRASRRKKSLDVNTFAVAGLAFLAGYHKGQTLDNGDRRSKVQTKFLKYFKNALRMPLWLDMNNPPKHTDLPGCHGPTRGEIVQVGRYCDQTHRQYF
ncbi:hypothetical protein H109_01401 [Trichophyton interdigitale MR816]|uniref:Uncharacterized protein n=1 Tax=Trichophyton interdigitale (strain MR816) TaxID=1215338 RepID=A0A059JG12_TRIIM|nr:hypothetical protein H109_01401 [Trichophyton interdigitale MR816]